MRGEVKSWEKEKLVCRFPPFKFHIKLHHKLGISKSFNSKLGELVLILIKDFYINPLFTAPINWKLHSTSGRPSGNVSAAENKSESVFFPELWLEVDLKKPHHLLKCYISFSATIRETIADQMSDSPYRFMYRIQLSTTLGIACPESFRRRVNKWSGFYFFF